MIRALSSGAVGISILLAATGVRGQSPCPSPGNGETALAAAANSLEAGQSCLLDTGLVGADLKPDPNYDSMLTWTDSAVWDPLGRRVRWIGRQAGCGNLDRPFRHLVYEEAANAWSFGTLPEDFQPCGHGYDHNALDPATGVFFHRRFSDGFVSVFDGTWSRTPDIPSSTTCCAGLAFFPEIALPGDRTGGLVYADAGIVAVFSGGEWVELARGLDPAIGGYHNFAEHNPVHREVLFGGGEEAMHIVYRLGTDGSISRAADAPVNLGPGGNSGHVTVDPVSGVYLAIDADTNSWWAFDPPANTWQPTDSPPALTEPGRMFQAPVPSYGVILMVEDMGFDDTPARVWVYRHAYTPPDTLPPAPPDGLQAQ